MSRSAGETARSPCGVSTTLESAPTSAARTSPSGRACGRHRFESHCPKSHIASRTTGRRRPRTARTGAPGGAAAAVSPPRPRPPPPRPRPRGIFWRRVETSGWTPLARASTSRETRKPPVRRVCQRNNFRRQRRAPAARTALEQAPTRDSGAAAAMNPATKLRLRRYGTAARRGGGAAEEQPGGAARARRAAPAPAATPRAPTSPAAAEALARRSSRRRAVGSGGRQRSALGDRCLKCPLGRRRRAAAPALPVRKTLPEPDPNSNPLAA